MGSQGLKHRCTVHRRSAVGAVLAGLLVVLPAAGQVYRCQVDGRTVYTDRACTPESTPLALPPLQDVPADGVNHSAVRRFNERAAAQAQAQRQADAAWLADYEVRRQREQAVRTALVHGDVIRGMTPAEVRRAWGAPTRESGKMGKSATWVYVNGRARRSVSFTDGIVSAVRYSERAPRRRR